MMDSFEEFVTDIKKELKIEQSIESNTLLEKLDITSFDMMILMVMFEEKYRCKIDGVFYESIQTVGELYEAILKCKKK